MFPSFILLEEILRHRLRNFQEHPIFTMINFTSIKKKLKTKIMNWGKFFQYSMNSKFGGKNKLEWILHKYKVKSKVLKDKKMKKTMRISLIIFLAISN